MKEPHVNPSSEGVPKCPQCGTPLPVGALAGLCPACLLMQGAAEDTNSAGEQPFNPPTVADLAPLFPQLEIHELIGKGGMGAVYRARQKQLDRVVALKILPPGIGSEPAFAERFTREAKALAKLNHPNIVTLYEFGSSGRESAQTGTTDVDASQSRLTSAARGSIYYFLMEFVDGVTLRQLLNAGRVSSREALAIVPQICDALQFAHDHGIVHRDIKPENILMDRRGRVKVADFGLAKIVEGNAPLTPPLSTSDGERVAKPGEGTVLTDANKVMGTPNYMAPEQFEHPTEVDHRADIYALGVVFYQMLTGELPGKKIEAPSKKVSIDVRLDEVVLRALERKPDLRYQQASVLKTQVETIAETSLVPGTTNAQQNRGKDFRTKQTLFGLPWVHITWGTDPATDKPRTAKGIIAIGPEARGVIAVGLIAFGVFPTGLLATGFFPVGLVAIGFFAVGFAAAGLQATGLFAFAIRSAVGLAAIAPKPVALAKLVIDEETVLGGWIFVVLFAWSVRNWIVRMTQSLMKADQVNAKVLPAVESWLALMDQKKYPESWDAAAPFFHRNMTREKWIAELEKVRRPLGNLLHRKVVTTLSAAAGKQRVAVYASAFEGLPSATETVTFTQQPNGEWLAIGYLIRPASKSASLLWLPTTPFSKVFGWVWLAIFAGYFFLLLNDHFGGPLDRTAWDCFNWCFISFTVASAVELLVRVRLARQARSAQGVQAVNSLWRPMILGGAFALVISAIFVAFPAYKRLHALTSKSDYIGQAYFPAGDSIEITSVARDENQIKVEGHYDLVSHDQASLELYITSTNVSLFPVAATQLMKISRGSGDFELVHPHPIPGLPHVNMYPVNGGHPFAELYFGTKEEAFQEGKLDLRERVGASDQPGSTGGSSNFGPVIERTITLGEVNSDGLMFVNLEKNEIMTPPFSPRLKPDSREFFERDARIESWIEGSGLDMVLHLQAENWGVIPLGTRLIYGARESRRVFDELTPIEVQTLIGNPKSDTNYFVTFGTRVAAYPASCTYIFKTRKGTTGILQVTGYTNVPPRVTVRYRLIQDSTSAANLRARLEVASSIMEAGKQSSALLEIVKDAIQANDLKLAKEAATQISEAKKSDEAIREIALALKRNGQLREAIEIAKTMIIVPERDKTLLELNRSNQRSIALFPTMPQ